MQLQFEKSEIPCLQQVAWQVQNQEQTQEVRVSDGMPDIGSVLGAWGQVILRSKEWRNGMMSLSGGVTVWVLYSGEEEGDPECVETWIPFQMKWDIPDVPHDGILLANCLLENVDARCISARKLMVRVNVSALGQGVLPGYAQHYLPKDMPEDIQILENTYPMELPVEAGEKPFALEETMPAPSAGGKPQKIIRYAMRPEIIDSKVLSGKVVFRGMGLVHMLYRGEDGNFYTANYEMPFSQYTDLGQEFGQEASAQVLPAVTAMEMETDADGNIHIKAGLVGQYLIYNRIMLPVVEDAYSLIRDVAPVMEELNLPMILEKGQQTVYAETSLPIEGARVVDICFYPQQGTTRKEQDSAKIGLGGRFQLLYRNEDGMLEGDSAGWQSELSVPAAENSRVDVMVMPTGKPMATVTGDGVVMRGDILVQTVTGTEKGIDMVKALDVGEPRIPDVTRPSLILRKAGEERLWDVAKKCGSSVAAIEQANHLQGQPDPEQILLIPVL